ncbi:glycosyltransferase family 4 protein [Flavobacteriaceae bacterium TP-CH-4]|uniref:Glycosyltransferase family 4 protein n=1 Tax=Pelagihabitans pacificus TaxID=2696054 RepID=A0A967AY99_9FLAO|nr:glycosyltransferase [Pelagihabitans pacificus]NHF61393.1 glycosyltransferase family 4 protein [Pelagihabitans pacificus]
MIEIKVRPKILFILHMPPPLHGAAKVGQHLFESAEINNSFECTFINLQTSKKLSDTGKGFFSKFTSFLSLYRKVFIALRSSSYDSCYMTINSGGFAYYKEIVIVFLLRLFNQNILYHFHNKGVSKTQHRTINHLLYRYSFKNVQCILSSERLYFDIKKYVSKEDVHYCFYGIPPTDYQQSVEKSSKEIDNIPKLLFLSNLIIEKGPYILLDACRLLKTRNVDFECHIVGDWGDITEDELIANIKERELTKHVVVHGRQVGRRKNELLSNSDVFVLPTLNDCSPLVLLEAMQAELPVITTIEGGIPDVVQDGKTGFLVKKHDAIQLADKMEILIQNPELRVKMGKAGKTRFEQQFTLDKFESRMVEIFANVVQD